MREPAFDERVDAAIGSLLREAGFDRARATSRSATYRRSYDWGYVEVAARLTLDWLHVAVLWRDDAVEARIAERSSLGGECQLIPLDALTGVPSVFAPTLPDRMGDVARVAGERLVPRLRRWTDRAAVAGDLLPEVDRWLADGRQTLLLVGIVLLALDEGLPAAPGARDRLLASLGGPDDDWVRHLLEGPA